MDSFLFKNWSPPISREYLLIFTAWVSSWWVSPPVEKYYLVELDHFPNFRGESSKNVWVATSYFLVVLKTTLSREREKKTTTNSTLFWKNHFTEGTVSASHTGVVLRFRGWWTNWWISHWLIIPQGHQPSNAQPEMSVCQRCFITNH